MDVPNQSSIEESVEDRLKRYFEFSVSSEITENNFPWNSISQYFETRKPDLFTLTNGRVFCDFFIRALENSICDNAAIFTSISDLITVFLLKNTDYENIFKCLKRHHLIIIMSYLRQNHKESVFSFREGIPVINALRIGNHKFMQILATYGCNGTVLEDSLFARRISRSMIEKFMWTICREQFYVVRRRNNDLSSEHRRNLAHPYLRIGQYEFPRITRLNSSLSSIDIYLRFPRDGSVFTISPLIQFLYDPLWQFKTLFFKRLFLVILGINALSLKLQSSPTLTNYVKCLEIYFRTISEPYLTVAEVRSHLDENIIPKSKEHLLDKLCEDFQDMPFCATKYEPRRLSHLARCQMRQTLCKNASTLPVVLDEMNIPKGVKKFILCKPLEESPYTF